MKRRKCKQEKKGKSKGDTPTKTTKREKPNLPLKVLMRRRKRV